MLKYLLLGQGCCVKMRGSSTHRRKLFITSHYVCHWSFSCFSGTLQCLIGISWKPTIMRLCVEGIWWISEDRFPIVIYTSHPFLSPGTFERFGPSDMRIMCSSESTTLSIDLTSISKSTSSGIPPHLYLPPQICSVHFEMEAFQWRIAITAILRGANQMLGKGWLLHQVSHALDEVATPVCYRV